MSRPWAVDLSPFGDEYANRFRVALKSLNIPFGEVDPCEMESSLRKIARRFENPFLYGSIALMKARDRVKEPTTVWLDWKECSYSQCAEKIAPYLLNYPYCTVLWRDIAANTDVLFNNDAEAAFVRPDSHDKIFSGARVTRSQSSKWVAQQEHLYSVPPETRCIVAKAQIKIDREWRVIVSEGKVLAWDTYCAPANNVATLPNIVNSPSGNDLAAVELAMNVAKKHPLPYPVFVVDVACDGDQVKVLELGSVNCCDWYGCSLEAIISEIQKYL